GIWKSVDSGVSWTSVADGQLGTGSVGAIAVSESDPNVLYAGMGEGCIRGNVSHGDGVYKSVDGGRTWKNVGLRDSRQIGRIRIHPQDPLLVYVAALGHAFGSNHERGVFRSRDGGATWTCALFEDDEGGLYRSDDAGRTWRRVNEERNMRQRAWYYTHVYADPKNADVVYVLNVQFLRSGDGGRTFRPVGVPHGDNHDLWID